MREKFLLMTLAATIAALQAAPVHATNWLQFGYDSGHSGYNRAETGYPTPGGNTVLYHYALPALAGLKGPGTVDGAPIYVGGVATAAGTRNILFGLTNNGTFYALDADSPTLSVLWSKQPTGTGKNTSGYGSGAVDPNLQFVYAYGFDGKIHKYQIGDGTEVTSGGWPATSTLKPDVDKGASGLGIATAHNGSTYLYSVTDGYIGDGGDYQGHLTTIDLATGAAKVFNSVCSNLTFHFVENGKTTQPNQTDCAAKQNGIWGRPGAIYDAGTDRVFVSTGNGPFNAAAFSWGDSVLALSADGSGSGNGNPVDSYTPTTFQNLQNTDADLGSGSIAIVPAPPGAGATYQHLGVQAGKDGCVRLLRLDNLSGQNAPAHTGGEIQAVDFRGVANNCANGGDGPEIRAQPAVWTNPADNAVWVYVASHAGGFAGYRLGVSAGVPALGQQWDNGDSDPTSPIVANGVVYYLSGGKLRAYDAVTGTARVTAGAWNTTSFSGPHWQSPLIVNGRIYLFDNANPSNLWVFQLDGAFKSGFE
jgi:hypothetical protein